MSGVNDALPERQQDKTGHIEGYVATLRDEIRRLNVLLSIARAGLWREWIEAGSIAAKEYYDRTAP